MKTIASKENPTLCRHFITTPYAPKKLENKIQIKQIDIRQAVCKLYKKKKRMQPSPTIPITSYLFISTKFPNKCTTRSSQTMFLLQFLSDSHFNMLIIIEYMFWLP